MEEEEEEEEGSIRQGRMIRKKKFTCDRMKSFLFCFVLLFYFSLISDRCCRRGHVTLAPETELRNDDYFI